MGGLGSGRYSGCGKATVEGCRSIDVNRWHKDGFLRPGHWFSWQWTRDGEKVASINVSVAERLVRLNYRYRVQGDDDWEPVQQAIPLTWTGCYFGGQRPWFICDVHASRIYCGRRVAKLYGAGRLFACRQCYGLAYQSQRERAYDRALTRTQKIRTRLGGSPSLGEPFPDKPKGMWWRTYERLRADAEHAEMQSWIGVAERFGFEF